MFLHRLFFVAVSCVVCHNGYVARSRSWQTIARRLPQSNRKQKPLQRRHLTTGQSIVPYQSRIQRDIVETSKIIYIKTTYPIYVMLLTYMGYSIRIYTIEMRCDIFLPQQTVTYDDYITKVEIH